MANALHILMLEDRPEDAALVKEELRKGGLDFSFERVETRADFVEGLTRHRPDIILSDHGLPAFDGLSALKVAKEFCPDVPFVFVTGALGEEFAIRTFETGATDYVLKHHLPDLVPTLQRALNSADEARKHRAQDEELRRNEALFRTLVEGVQDYAIYMLDPNGRIATWNKGAERIEGYTTQEILGQSFSKFFTPEDAARGKPRQLIERARREGRCEDEGWRQRKDGSRFWANVVITALHDAEGRLQGFAKVARDMTERKQYEETIRRSESRLRSILETALDAIVVMDAEGIVHEWNRSAERMFGYARGEAVGKRLADLIIPPYLRDHHHAGLTRFLLDRSGPILNQRIETIALRRDGSEFPVELAITVAEPDGGSPMFTGYISDITERQRTSEQIKLLNTELEQRVRKRTEQLELANRELEAFSYSVSHDLRAPLRHINGFVEILQSTAAEQLDQESRGFLDTIAESARQMGKLIDDLLAFSRMGRTELRFVPVKLDNVVAESLRELRQEFENREVHLDIAPMPDVEGDPAMLRQVFINLFSNALKYSRTREQTEIRVRAEASDSEVIVSVQDNGVGFDNAYAHKLFGVFQRLHAANDFEGTGIGLAIVRRVVARHGGRVWAEGEVDRGATFYIAIPKKSGDAQPEPGA